MSDGSGSRAQNFPKYALPLHPYRFAPFEPCLVLQEGKPPLPISRGDERRRMEEEELINMLRREEAEEKMRLQDEERKRKAEEARAEMMRANAYQMKLKVRRLDAGRAGVRRADNDTKGGECLKCGLQFLNQNHLSGSQEAYMQQGGGRHTIQAILPCRRV